MSPDRPKLCEFTTNAVAQATGMCADEEKVAVRVEAVLAGRLDARRPVQARCFVRAPSGRITHALVSGLSLNVGGRHSQGMCKICKYNHACKCTTFSMDVGSDKTETVLVVLCRSV